MPEIFFKQKHVHPDDIENMRNLYKRLHMGEQNVSVTVRWRANISSPYWWAKITYTTIFDKDGNPHHAIGSSVDISAQKQLEQKYTDEVNFQRTEVSSNLLVKVRSNITQNVVESYIANNNVGISASGTPYDIGSEQLASTGYTAQQRNLIRKMLNRSRVLKAYEQGETKYSIDYQRKAHDGSAIWVNTTVNTYKNPETGDVISFMYSYDINEEKIKEGIIEAVSLMEYDFISYVDLNKNLLRMYMGTGHMIMDNHGKPQEYYKSMQSVVKTIVLEQDYERVLNAMSP